MADVIINNAYPGIQYEGTETGHIYCEDREVGGLMYRTQNAQYSATSLSWSLYDTTKAAYATRHNADGSLSFLTVPVTQSTNPWTVWNGAAQDSVYNAKDFGASPNLSDNSGPINNAIAACSAAGGGIVYLPPGQYKTTSSIVLMTGVRLKGPAACVGADSGSVSLSATTGAVIVPASGYDTIMTPTTADSPFCGVEDLTIYGSAGAHWVIHVYAASTGLLIRNVAIVVPSTTESYGILLDSLSAYTTQGACLDNVSVRSSYRSSGDPVFTGIQLGASNQVNACVLTGIQVEGFEWGIKDGDGGGNTILGAWVSLCTYGIYVNSDTLLVVGGWFSSNSTAVHFSSSSNTNTVFGGWYTSGTNAVVIESNATAPRVMQLGGFNPVGTSGWPVTIPRPSATNSTQNNFGTDAIVFVTANAGTAVTEIQVGGTAIPDASQSLGRYRVNAGHTSFGIRVPVGQTIELTWSGANAPTWEWFGD